MSLFAFAKTFRSRLAQKAMKHGASACSDIITVSLGLSSNDFDKTKDALTILDEADQALYTSKLSGRNAYSIWTEKSVNP